MKRSALALLLVSVIALLAPPAQAWHRWHGGVFVGVGPLWWGAPYWWEPPYYPYPPPPVVMAPPPVYIERPPPPPPPPPAASWYYCESARRYYPYVETCPEPWVKVPARPR
jgi:hypothetical protein